MVGTYTLMHTNELSLELLVNLDYRNVNREFINKERNINHGSHGVDHCAISQLIQGSTSCQQPGSPSDIFLDGAH